MVYLSGNELLDFSGYISYDTYIIECVYKDTKRNNLMNDLSKFANR